MTDQQDPYARVHYRHLIAWPERMRREGPLLERVLGEGPSRRVLDLGSGPGDHARFLATRGFDVTGIDSSQSMIDTSREQPVPDNVRFLLGDFLNLPSLVEGTFGGAICLGNVLPHLTERAQLSSLARGLGQVLAPGGRVLLQILNYERIAAAGERALPVNVQPDPEVPEAELVLVRLMRMNDDGSALFFPVTMRLRPDADPPIELLVSRRVELFGWRLEDIRSIFTAEGISEVEALGDFQGAPFAARTSRDLIWIGRLS